MNYSALEDNHGLKESPWNALIAPRPIAWISSVSNNGDCNIAPFSYFQAVGNCHEPPYYVSVTMGIGKDTLNNIQYTHEFVVNMVSYDMRERMNITAEDHKPEEDEFEIAGITKEKCVTTSVPRLKESPISIECNLFKILPLPDDNGEIPSVLVIAKAKHVHIKDKYIVEGRISTHDMGLITRLGYDEYSTINTVWKMPKPYYKFIKKE